MDREEFKRRLLEEQIFEELKDGYFGGINYIRCKYEGSGIDFSRVYRRIINYRIEKFGTSSLPSPKMYSIKSRKEAKRLSLNAYARKKYWRKTYGQN